MFIQTNPRVTININELEEKLINENIYNYNIDKITQAIQNSNGTPIEIGEVFKKSMNPYSMLLRYPLPTTI